jgi:hypothetical protein
MKRFRARLGLILLLCVSALPGPAVLAQEALEPRLQIGINLLPAVIAANKGLNTDPSSATLPIYLVYRENRHLAEQLRDSLGRVGIIRKRVIEIIPISLNSLLASKTRPLSSIFIAEPMNQELEDLIQFARQHRALLFSPFKGDVEKGVPAGFKVTDKVLPMVNMASLRESKIQLKAFFLRIAVKYE